MKITYDKLADAVYIYLTYTKNQTTNTDSFEIKKIIPFGDINIDFDKNNLIVGIEILEASRHLSKKFLKSLNQL